MTPYEHRQMINKFVADNKLRPIACENCNGTGLKNYYKHADGSFSWSGEYCDNCNGTGFIRYEVLDESIYVCPKCNANNSYCKFCNSTGFVDWIENIMKRVAT